MRFTPEQLKYIEDLELMRQVFDKYGCKFSVVYGALLGFYRDGSFLPGDDDIDLAVIDKIDYKTRKAIGWMLYDLGFRPQSIMFNVFGRMEVAEIGYNGDDKTGIIVCERNIKFTIFFFQEEDCKQHGKEYVCIPKLGAMKLISTPTRFFKQYSKIKIGKHQYNAPAPIEDYLSHHYFGNWKDPMDRRHSDTYNAQHSDASMKNIMENNEAAIWKKSLKKI